MKILICDDEPLARTRLIRMLSKIGGHEVVDEAQNGFEALEMTQRYTPDSLIIDIQMPGIDGLETASHIAKLDKPPAIVFSTAYGEYAMEAFNVNAIAYLLKPVQLEKLSLALDNCQKLNLAQLHALHAPSTLAEGTKKITAHRNFISARTHKGVELIPIDDIIYLKADQKYITIRHVGGEVLVNDALKILEPDLGDGFVRIHRNAIVAQHHIRRIEATSDGHNLVFLEGIAEPLRASRRHMKTIKSTLPL